MKHRTSIPPIECEIILTFLPPEALYAVSNLTLRPSINLPILPGVEQSETQIFSMKIKELLVISIQALS